MMFRYYLIVTVCFLLASTGAEPPHTCSPEAPVQERVRDAPLVFHGLAVDTEPPLDPHSPPGLPYTAHFWLISVYKGARPLADLLGLDHVVDIRDRRVNVSGLSVSQCGPPLISQKYFVVLARVENNRLLAVDEESAFLEWSSATEHNVWRGVGWGDWSDWSPCSLSCGGGSQQRSRRCLLELDSCDGFNTETRKCNSFNCQGAVSLLSPDQRRYLHGQWGRVPDRQTAWRLRSNAYLWVPAAELPAPARNLRKHFALLATLRVNPKERAPGTLFSLRSRRQKDAYLSVELAGTDTVKLVHSGTNGTQTVLIPASVIDGTWHQLALGVAEDSSVRSYQDCRWLSTDILRRDALDIPEDADVVIGYLFSGDLEQLTVVADVTAVSQQCTSGRVPSMTFVSKTEPARLETEDWQSPANNEIWQDDEDLFQGSGAGVPYDNYEVKWSEWSKCSVSCGLGEQTRRTICSESSLLMDLCVEKVETRPCSVAPCESQTHNTSEPDSNDVCQCQNGGTCHLKRRTCHCPVGYEGLRCEIRSCPGPCLHGGICHNSGYCSCPPEYTGQTCQIPVCRPPCMNGGLCIKPGVCSCPNQFNHPRCATVCPGGCEPGGACVSPGVCQCLPGYHGSLCQESLCPQGCYNGGSCSGPRLCKCPAGWTGPDCSTPVCEPACERGGRCVGPQQCLCPANTHGQHCQNFSCPGGCLNGGVCVGPGLCECPTNASGPTCARPLCDPPCENGATCASGNTCLCGPHTSGTRCQLKSCDYRFVQEPYTRAFRKLVKRRVRTRCGEGGGECWRTVAEFRTLHKTFYRTVYKCASDQH